MTKENKQLSLLVVEDNPGDFVLLKKNLQRSSISVGTIQWAKHLSEVEALANSRVIDLAFLDLTLPDSTGVNSFITLNNYLPHVPIIVLSGLLDMEVALETISLGAQDFLMKGEFDEKLLAKSIQYSVERKKTMEKLQESNERFKYVTQATFDAVWDCKLFTKELYWAENFTTLFGHTAKSETDNFKLWPELLHPEDRERVIDRLDKHIESAETNWVEEYRIKKADGQYSTVLDKAIILRDNTGTAYRMIGAMQDITRQKEEEHRLKLFQSVIVNANEGVIITEATPFEFPGRIIYLNEAMTKITGYRKEEWSANPSKILYGSNSDPNELERLFTSMMRWEACEIEILNNKKNGEEFWMNLSVVPIANERDEFTHWISITRDVTERKNHTKAIEKQNIKLKEIAWMQSHVVRAPLARMIGLINAVHDHEAMKMSQSEVFDHIINAAYELDNIIREIVAKASEIKSEALKI